MGCFFDCVYCYINGSKYAEDTDNYYVKTNAPDLVYKTLKKKFQSKEKAMFLLGSASDPYMPIENELFITRDILHTFQRFKYPIHIITKSDLILRDIDILKKINKLAILPDDLTNLKSKVVISFSFSILNDKIAKIFEPKAPLVSERLNTMKTLANEGFNVGASFMPILPFLSDSEEEIANSMGILKDFNCNYVIPGSMSLFGDKENSSRIKYYKTIEKYFPDISKDTENLFENKEYPSSYYQNSLYKKVGKIANKYGIKTRI
jgi:DNA repair photolyase